VDPRTGLDTAVAKRENHSLLLPGKFVKAKLHAFETPD
jgi:hypothetical protein